MGAGSARTGGQAVLWFCVLAGPLAWSVQLLVNYFFVALACHGQLSGTPLGHEAVTVVTGGITLVALLVARAKGRDPAVSSTQADPPAGRTLFMARTGVVISALFLFIIAAGAYPSLILPACV